jgi:hypothetical protein
MPAGTPSGTVVSTNSRRIGFCTCEINMETQCSSLGEQWIDD